MICPVAESFIGINNYESQSFGKKDLRTLQNYSSARKRSDYLQKRKT